MQRISQIILRFSKQSSVKSGIYLRYSGKSGVVERRSEEVRGHLILNTSKRPTQSTQRGRHSPRGAVEGTASEQSSDRREKNKAKQRIFKERTMIRPMFLSSSLILVATAAAADPLYFGEFLSLVMFFKRGLILKIGNGKFVHSFLSTKN